MGVLGAAENRPKPLELGALGRRVRCARLALGAV